MNNLIYGIDEKPTLRAAIVLAFQQVLAILSATITVPMIIGNEMDPAAAIFGAGIGTLIYLFFTQRKSPVFLGSSFAFIGSMLAAFAGATSVALGYMGLIIGAIFAGLVYVVIAIAVKTFGTGWISSLMPPVVIGPTVAIIGLSLASSAITNFTSAGGIGVVIGLITLFVTMGVATFGNKQTKMIPFIIGILAGYIIALVLTLTGTPIIDTSIFANMSIISIPKFVFLRAYGAMGELTPGYIATVAVAYIPVAFVVFAEHLADHKNISSIIGTDLLENPGLHRTLLGDGIGSIGGAFFGGCPNTTYGESIACVAITRNASTYTILIAAIECIIISFIGPITAIISSIPACVMGAVCIALYGFIAVSGLKMLQPVDLNDNANLFTASVILIIGIGGFTLSFGAITLTTVACALILGIVTNKFLHRKDYKEIIRERIESENGVL